MEETKNILLFKTIWGAAIAVIGAVMNAMGFETSALNGIDGEIVTLVGGVIAAYGRVKAVKKIK